jgi:hypothetical protein
MPLVIKPGAIDIIIALYAVLKILSTDRPILGFTAWALGLNLRFNKHGNGFGR